MERVTDRSLILDVMVIFVLDLEIIVKFIPDLVVMLILIIDLGLSGHVNKKLPGFMADHQQATGLSFGSLGSNPGNV